MRRVQLYGTGAATASAVANVTIPSAGKLRGCAVWVAIDSVTDNSRIICELSRIPTSQILVNGSQEPIVSVGSFTNIGAAGADTNTLNMWFPLDVDVRQGEIIYLHASVSGVLTYYANFILFYA